MTKNPTSYFKKTRIKAAAARVVSREPLSSAHKSQCTANLRAIVDDLRSQGVATRAGHPDPAWWRARGIELMLSCSFAGPDFGPLGELVVIVCDPQHDCLRRVLFHRITKRAHLLTPLPPMIRVIGQEARRR